MKQRPSKKITNVVSNYDILHSELFVKTYHKLFKHGQYVMSDKQILQTAFTYTHRKLQHK
jgi:hypothetical protein